jgi:hypothetical protein
VEALSRVDARPRHIRPSASPINVKPPSFGIAKPANPFTTQSCGRTVVPLDFAVSSKPQDTNL